MKQDERFPKNAFGDFPRLVISLSIASIEVLDGQDICCGEDAGSLEVHREVETAGQNALRRVCDPIVACWYAGELCWL